VRALNVADDSFEELVRRLKGPTVDLAPAIEAVGAWVVEHMPETDCACGGAR
jgi:hypothetical protein